MFLVWTVDMVITFTCDAAGTGIIQFVIVVRRMQAAGGPGLSLLNVSSLSRAYMYTHSTASAD